MTQDTKFLYYITFTKEFNVLPKIRILHPDMLTNMIKNSRA